MARTLSEIYLAIVAEKNNQTTINTLQPAIDSEQTLLDDLCASSKVADWRLFVYIIAVAIWLHENIWDLFKAEVDSIVESAIPGTSRWYQSVAFIFQYGDALSWIDNKFKYETVDVTKQIIKRSATIETGGVLYIKVAKLNGNDPVKLDAGELTAFRTYINDIKFAGTNISIISADADRLKLTLNIIYDPLVLASNGSLLTNSAIFPVEDAINDYLAGIVWAGTFNLTKLIDAIQVAQGVVDPILTTVEGKAYGGIYNIINQNYQSISGYMIIDPDNLLNTTLTYTANV